MNWANQLERRFGKFAIHGLTRWIVLFNAMGYIALHLNPQMAEWLCMDGQAVLNGEWWRLFTYLFLPPNLSPLWIVFALYFTFMVGEGLEQEWGAFRLNLYYLIGMMATTVIAFFFTPGSVTNIYLNTSLFLAFATVFPNFEILLFFILPVKMKWMGLFTAVMLGFNFMVQPLGGKCAILISLANYFLFFASTIREQVGLRRQVARARSHYRAQALTSQDTSFHCCKICGKTEVSYPDMQFRVASDDEEYCLEHLPSKPVA